MLDAIRKRSGSIVVKVLLGLLVLSFAAWGVGDYISQGSQQVDVATVGERTISPQDLNVAVQRELVNLRNSTGQAIDLETARSMGLVDGILNSMVQRAIFSEAARELGLVVSDEQIRAAVHATPAFQGDVGGFDRARFEQVLRNAGFSEQEYLALVREDMARTQLLQSLGAGADVPEMLLDAVFAYREERRTADYFFIPDSRFTEVAEPTDAEVRAHYDENTDRYMAPEYRALTVVELAAADLADTVKVTDEELRTAYENREAEFVTLEQRRLEQAIFADAQSARAAREAIQEGRPFAEVAMETTGASADSIELGWVGRQELLAALADPAFSIPVGTVSEPVETALGWHLLYVVEERPGGRKTLDEVREQLHRTLAREKAVDSLYELANDLEDQLGGGATLEEAAAAVDVPALTVDAVDRQGRDRNGEPVSGLPGGEFLQTAFSLEEGTASLLTEAGEDSYFVVRVDSVTPPAPRPLENVRDRVREDILAERRRAAARDAAQQAVAQLDGGADMAEVAADQGASVATSPPFRRSGQAVSGALPRALVGELFDLSIGQAGSGERSDGVVVARLDEVIPAAATEDADEARSAIAQNLTAAMETDIYTQFSEALRREIPVSVNRAAVDRAL